MLTDKSWIEFQNFNHIVLNQFCAHICINILVTIGSFDFTSNMPIHGSAFVQLSIFFAIEVQHVEYLFDYFVL